MGEAVIAIAKMNATAGHYPIGWNIYINNTWSQYVMDTYKATDRSISQSVNPPVIFSDDFGNIKNATIPIALRIGVMLFI